MAPQPTPIEEFLNPFHIDHDKIDVLSQRFLQTFRELAATAEDQFLPTPISESILRPEGERSHGCHLAIDIGGTNLRVGFVEVLNGTLPAHDGAITNGDHAEAPGGVRRLLEKSWPIDDHLKSENSEGLFLWIGKCIADVVRDGCGTLQLGHGQAIPLGVTFSFPMVQHSLSEATLMSMGKGFAISSDSNLGALLMEGYRAAKTADLPDIRVDAIANDSVSTLVAFIYKFGETESRRATMGLILGTGCNATIPLKLSQLHPSKHPRNVTTLATASATASATTLGVGERVEDTKIAVNTEWSINGTAPPLREMRLITSWDRLLDSQNETPGFQPLEYMTAGRYLGELGRIMLVDYLTRHMGIPRDALPEKLLQRHSLTTTFLSHFRPLRPPALANRLRREFDEPPRFVWTEDMAAALFHIAKAIQVRAAGIIAAATWALLTLAEEIPEAIPEEAATRVDNETRQLGVGYTGGCIVHFQDYLEDCQRFIDGLIERRFGKESGLSVVLSPCHDGGITGAGILVAAAAAAASSSR